MIQSFGRMAFRGGEHQPLNYGYVGHFNRQCKSAGLVLRQADKTLSRGWLGRGTRVYNGRGKLMTNRQSKRKTIGHPSGPSEPTNINNMAESSARENPLRAASVLYRRGAAEIFTLSHRNFTWLSVNCLHSFSCSIHWSSSFRDVLSSIIRT